MLFIKGMAQIWPPKHSLDSRRMLFLCLCVVFPSSKIIFTRMAQKIPVSPLCIIWQGCSLIWAQFSIAIIGQDTWSSLIHRVCPFPEWSSEPVISPGPFPFRVLCYEFGEGVQGQPCLRPSDMWAPSWEVQGTTTLCMVTSSRPVPASSGPASMYSTPGRRGRGFSLNPVY